MVLLPLNSLQTSNVLIISAIFFGFVTFTLTIIAVIILLTLGGSWERIEKQANSGEKVSAPDAITQQKRPALLVERLFGGMGMDDDD